MSPLPKGSAIYKKKEGALSISSNKKLLQWLPRDGGSTVAFAIADIISPLSLPLIGK
jgi:hypothetical protein